MSQMRDTMASQPALLRALLADAAPVEAAAERLRGRRVWLSGTGTSWHAANHGAWFLHAAGVDARAVQAADAALGGPAPAGGDGLLLLSHTGAKRHAETVLERARAGGVECVVIGARGRDGVDVTTVGARELVGLHRQPSRRAARLAAARDGPGRRAGRFRRGPRRRRRGARRSRARASSRRTRLLEFTGVGANQWTAAEGALKVRETARVATEGLSAEQLLHGPARRPRRARRARVPRRRRAGGRAARRRRPSGRARRRARSPHLLPDLGEPLSVFPLTVAVQRIALEAAEALGTDPDAFGYDVPGRKDAWEAVGL